MYISHVHVGKGSATGSWAHATQPSPYRILLALPPHPLRPRSLALSLVEGQMMVLVPTEPHNDRPTDQRTTLASNAFSMRVRHSSGSLWPAAHKYPPSLQTWSSHPPGQTRTHIHSSPTWSAARGRISLERWRTTKYIKKNIFYLFNLALGKQGENVRETEATGPCRLADDIS